MPGRLTGGCDHRRAVSQPQIRSPRVVIGAAQRGACAMLVDVVRLREGGMRLRQGELQPAVRGDLEINDDAGTALSFKRPVRMARLTNRIGVQQQRQDALLQIFDARVIRIEDDTLTIIGTELSSQGSRVTECGQIWRCTLVR